MKKLGKFIIGIIVVLVVLALVLVLTLPLTIGPIVKQAAAVGGPKALGVPVAVGDVKFNPLAGRLAINQVKIGNPEGYSEKDAFAVDNIEVVLNINSLFSDTIVIKKVQIDAPAISYEVKNKLSNFDAMMANVKKAAEESKQEQEKTPGDKDKGKESKRVVIEEFSLNQAKIAYASGLTLGKSVTVPLPSVTVKDIGKSDSDAKSGGATPAEAATAILNGVMGGITKALTNIAGGAGDLLKGAGGAVSEGGEAAGKLIKGLGSSANEAVGDATSAAKDAAGTAKDAVKDAAGAAKEATKSLKKLNPFK